MRLWFHPRLTMLYRITGQPVPKSLIQLPQGLKVYERKAAAYRCWRRSQMNRQEAMRRITVGDRNLVSADLSNANMSGVYLLGSNLKDANLNGSNLSGAELRRVDFRGADLRNADLTHADLRGARYDHHTQWPDGFDPVYAEAVLKP